MVRARHKRRRTVKHTIDLRFHINKEVSDATLAYFCDGSQNFPSLPRLMYKFIYMEHVQNVEKLCQRLDVLSDCYSENRSYSAHQKNDPKTLILIWALGASFGLTTFHSDFIDYVKGYIPVKDVTKINSSNWDWHYAS